MSVPNREVAVLSDPNDSQPELLDTDSEDDVWEDDRISESHAVMAILNRKNCVGIISESSN